MKLECFDCPEGLDCPVVGGICKNEEIDVSCMPKLGSEQFGCCDRWMDCLGYGHCVLPTHQVVTLPNKKQAVAWSTEKCGLRGRLERMTIEDMAKEHATWLARIEEVTVAERGSIRFGYFKDRPTKLYMFVGVVPEFFKIGTVQSTVKKRKSWTNMDRELRKKAAEAQELATSIFEMDRSIRPKSYHEFAEMIKAVILPGGQDERGSIEKTYRGRETP